MNGLNLKAFFIGGALHHKVLNNKRITFLPLGNPNPLHHCSTYFSCTIFPVLFFHALTCVHIRVYEYMFCVSLCKFSLYERINMQYLYVYMLLLYPPPLSMLLLYPPPLSNVSTLLLYPPPLSMLLLYPPLYVLQYTLLSNEHVPFISPHPHLYM